MKYEVEQRGDARISRTPALCNTVETNELTLHEAMVIVLRESGGVMFTEASPE